MHVVTALPCAAGDRPSLPYLAGSCLCNCSNWAVQALLGSNAPLGWRRETGEFDVVQVEQSAVISSSSDTGRGSPCIYKQYAGIMQP